MSRFSAALLLSTLSLIALPATAQLAGQTVRFSSVLTGGIDGTTGDCLTASKNADGAAVVIQPCGNNATQLNSWVSPNGVGVAGPLKIFGDKCLDVVNGVNADGTKLQIWTCATGNTNQMWVPGGQEIPIAWSGKGKCIDLTGGNTTAGNQFQVWTCDNQNDNQRFNNLDVTEPKTRTIKPKADTTKCVTAASHTVGAAVIISPCVANSPEQAWSAPISRQLAVSGATASAPPLCITPANDNFLADGTKLVLAECDLTGTKSDQFWGFSSQGSVINNGGFAKNVCSCSFLRLHSG
ncbi:ricin B lectin domain-containing protein [Mycena amicta]|nr:ricin B lectin domain-containing protein [Mycena amicta]